MKYIPYHNPNPLRKDIQSYLHTFQNTSFSRPHSTTHSIRYMSNKSLTVNPNIQIITQSNPNNSPSITPSSPKSVHNIHTYKRHACSRSNNHYSLLNTESNLCSYTNSSLPINNDVQTNKNFDLMNFQIKCNVLLAKLESLKMGNNNYEKLGNFERDTFIEKPDNKLQINRTDEKEEEEDLSILADELVDVFELDTINHNNNAQIWSENDKNTNNDMVIQSISVGEELKIGDLIVDTNQVDINNNHHHDIRNKELSINNNNSHKKGINIDNEKIYSEDIYTLTESNEKEKNFNERNSNNTFNINPPFKATDLNEKDIINVRKDNMQYDLSNNSELPMLNQVLQTKNENNKNQELIDLNRNDNSNCKDKVLPSFKEMSVQTCSEFSVSVLQPINLNMNQQLMFSSPVKNEESKDLVGSGIFSSSELNRASITNENETENEVNNSRFKPTLIETLPDFRKQQTLNHDNQIVNQVNNNEITNENIQLHKDKIENSVNNECTNDKQINDNNLLDKNSKGIDNKSNNINNKESQDINRISLENIIKNDNNNLIVNEQNKTDVIDDNNKINEIKEANVINEQNTNNNQKQNNVTSNNNEETKLVSSNRSFNTDEEEDMIFSTIMESAKRMEEERKLKEKEKQQQETTPASTLKYSTQKEQLSRKTKKRKKPKKVKFNFDELSVIEYDEDDLITDLYIYDYYGKEIPFKPKNMKRYFSLLEDIKTGVKKLKPSFINSNNDQNDNNYEKHGIDEQNNEDEEQEEKEEEEEEEEDTSFTISGKKYTLLNPVSKKVKTKENKNTKGNIKTISTPSSAKSNSSSTRNMKSKNKSSPKNTYSSNVPSSKRNNSINIMQRNINYLQEVYKTGSVWRKSKSVQKVITKPHRTNCKKFVENPQKFFTEDLCDNVLQSYNLKTINKSNVKSPITNKNIKQNSKLVKKKETINEHEKSYENYNEYSNSNRRKYSV